MQIGHIRIDQSVQAAKLGGQVHIVADYAITPAAINQALIFTLQKGDLNDSDVRFYVLAGDTKELIEEAKDTGQDNPGAHNPVNISLNLNLIEPTPSKRSDPAHKRSKNVMGILLFLVLFEKLG